MPDTTEAKSNTEIEARCVCCGYFVVATRKPDADMRLKCSRCKSFLIVTVENGQVSVKLEPKKT